MIISSQLPDLTRTDCHIVLVSEWSVGTPVRQRAAADAFIAIWEREAWPSSLLSANLFASNDGETVLNYAQWKSGEIQGELARDHWQSCKGEIDPVIPGIKRKQPVQYRLYRSMVRNDPPVAGCVVIASVEFQGADEQRQRRWVDKVFEALEAETELPPGGIAGHFHISTDGTRVINYAEWTDEQAHREALEKSAQGTIGPGPKWLDVKNFPGILSYGFKRYHHLRSLLSGRARSAGRTD